MIRIIDKYLIKQFVQTILFGLLAFVLIFVIIDMMENLDDFIDENVPTNVIVQYYIVFIPEMMRLMIPVSVLLASLFVAGKMSNLNELTAIKASGVSLYRYMLPFLFIAMLISLLSIYFGGYVVPLANEHKVFIERTYMNKGIARSGSNIIFQDSKTRIVSIGSYSANTEQAYRISIQDFNPDEITKITARIDAARMRYDSLSGKWSLFDGVRRYFDNSTENIERFSALEVKDLSFTPDQIIEKQRRNPEMNLTELKDYADSQLSSGNDPTRILIEYHSRIAFSFASIITVLFGLPISANKRKGGLAVQFGINLLITFIYLVFMNISQAFGKNGVMNPILTAWFANILFFSAALINLVRARK